MGPRRQMDPWQRRTTSHRYDWRRGYIHCGHDLCSYLPRAGLVAAKETLLRQRARWTQGLSERLRWSRLANAAGDVSIFETNVGTSHKERAIHNHYMALL